MFDRKMYWKRRHENKRGQGDKLPRFVASHLYPDWPEKEVSIKARRKNTKRARKAAI